MRFCVWSGSSFEQWYSSYHLMQQLLLAMIDKGHEVWLVQAQRVDGRMPEDLQNRDRLHVVNIPQPAVEKSDFIQRYIKGFQYYLLSGKMVRKTAKAIGGFDAVFLQSNNNAIIPVEIAKQIRTPVVYNVQDIFPIDAMVIGKLKKSNPAFVVARWLQAQAYRKADRVVTISEDLKKTIVGEGRKDVDVIYNWSYRNEAYDIPDDQNHFLQTYGFKRGDGFRVVYAGNVGQMMNWNMIIESAKLLLGYEDIVFYIIGEGSGLKRLKARAEEEKLSNIRFYDRQPMEYAPDNYCMADVNINPVPKGVMYTCMPSKTATCLLSQRPTVVAMDPESDMAGRLSKVDQWTVVAPDDVKGMTEAILKYYNEIDWRNGESKMSKDAGTFLNDLGPVENAYKYVRVLEEAAKRKKYEETK